jgi:pyruvate dehydrogenase E2 component (dihydrolipoamide acetyltransferase)
MATKVHMEALSPTMEEGQVVKWHKAEGDAVKSGEILADVETDKATMELTARGDGVLAKVLAGEGQTVPVGQVIAIIAAKGEDIAALVKDAGGNGKGAAAAEAPAAKAPEKAAAAGTSSATASSPQAAATEAPTGTSSEADTSREGGRIKASPLARRMAEASGVDLGRVEGSGPGGRVVKRDVEIAASAPQAPAVRTGAPAPAWSGSGAAETYEEVKVTQMRKTIAKRLTESLGPIPTFYLTIDVDMERTLAARARVNQLLEGTGDKVSVNDFVLKAVAGALRRHPECNAAWHGDHIRRFGHVHLGVAVAVEDGLITPVVKHADMKGLAQISREVKEMAGRAREKKLKPEEYTGATFSVSNLGMFGIEEFTAIINPPEAGILAIGRTEERAVVIGGQIVIRPRMKLTMSCDHRVIDGATGAKFLQTLHGMLEEPAAIMV